MSDANRVREARDELDRAMERYANAEHPSREYPHNQRKYDRDVADNQRMLDAYAAAIRAECAAEIAALKADAERLDWLEAFVRAHDEQDIPLAHCRDDTDDQGAAQMKFVIVNNYEIADFGKGKTLRDAIDAARAEGVG